MEAIYQTPHTAEREMLQLQHSLTVDLEGGQPWDDSCRDDCLRVSLNKRNRYCMTTTDGVL